MTNIRKFWSRDDETRNFGFGRNGRLIPMFALSSSVGFAWGVEIEGDAPAKATAQDLEDLHRWTSAGLREAHVRLPTVAVVYRNEDRDRDWETKVLSRLEPSGNSAATWIAWSGQCPRSVAKDLLDPEVVKVSFHSTTEADFDEKLETWMEEPRFESLVAFLEAVRGYRHRSSTTGLDEYRREAEADFRRTLERVALHEPTTTNSSTPAESQSRIATPGSPRISMLKLENVAGLEHLEIPFADHVTIITGGNGTGKSTISNALLRVLTGDSHWDNRRLSRQRSTTASITIQKQEEGHPTCDTIEITGNDTREQGWWTAGTLIPRRVMRNLTGLLDQQIEPAMTDGDRPAILQTLRSRSPREEALWQLLLHEEDGSSRVEQVIGTVKTTRKDEMDLAGMCEEHRSFVEDLRQGLLSVLGDSAPSEIDSGIRALIEQLESTEPPSLEVDLPRRLLEAVRDAQQTTSTHSGHRSRSDVERELGAVEATMESHRAVLDWLRTGQSNLGDLLDGLLEGNSRWASPPTDVPPEICDQVVEAFQQVQIGALSDLRDHVRRSTERATHTMRQVRDLRIELAGLQGPRNADEMRNWLDATRQGLEQWLSNHEAAWNNATRALRRSIRASENLETNRRELSRLDDVSGSLNALRDAMSAQLGDELAGQIQRAVNRVVRRYGTIGDELPGEGDDGPLHLRIDKAELMQFKLDGPHGRDVSTLSTGQKHQFTLARVIAERQLIQASQAGKYIGHRCIILDDVAASHDEDALARESLILRQLAYHPNEPNQVQLIILTHHRGLAERYCELLAPPPDCRAKLIQLANDPLKGCREFDLLPSHALDQDNEKHLRKALFRALTFGRRSPSEE